MHTTIDMIQVDVVHDAIGRYVRSSGADKHSWGMPGATLMISGQAGTDSKAHPTLWESSAYRGSFSLTLRWSASTSLPGKARQRTNRQQP